MLLNTSQFETCEEDNTSKIDVVLQSFQESCHIPDSGTIYLNFFYFHLFIYYLHTPTPIGLQCRPLLQSMVLSYTEFLGIFYLFFSFLYYLSPQ